MRTVVGYHSCIEVFKVRPKAITSVYLKKDFKESASLQELHDLARKHNRQVRLVSTQELNKLSTGHQGVALDVSESPRLDIESLKKKEQALLIALDGVEDPQNLGSILRSAWLMGADGILITKNRSVGLTPTVCKIASGGAEHVPIEEYNQLIQAFQSLKEEGFWVYGLSEKSSQEIFNVELAPKTILVAGSEMKGLKPQTQKACDELISIPQKQVGPSLNVAISVTLGIYEYSRILNKKS